MSMINPNSLARLSFTVDAAAKTLDIGVKAPFKMWIPDPASAGSFFEKTITAPTTIYGDGHASENFNTGEAGQTLDRDWLSDYPLTWYLTIESGNIYWVCSRNPCMTQMPAAAGYIGDFSAEPATATTLQTNVFIAASVTVADFVDLPVWPIGTMPVQRAAASQIPTLVALTAGKDGAGLWNKQTKWTMPLGQNGNEDGKLYTVTDGATALDIDDQLMTYKLGRNGAMSLSISFTDCDTNGSDATTLRVYTPLGGYLSDAAGTLRYTNLSATIANPPMSVFAAIGASNLVFYLTDGSALNDDDFLVSAVCRLISSITIQVF